MINLDPALRPLARIARDLATTLDNDSLSDDRIDDLALDAAAMLDEIPDSMRDELDLPAALPATLLATDDAIRLSRIINDLHDLLP